MMHAGTGPRGTSNLGGGPPTRLNQDAPPYNNVADEVQARHPCAPAMGESASGARTASEQSNALLTGTFQSITHETEPRRRTSSEGGGRTYKRHAGRNLLQARSLAPGDPGSLTAHDPAAWPALVRAGANDNKHTDPNADVKRSQRICERMHSSGLGDMVDPGTRATQIEPFSSRTTGSVQQDRHAGHACSSRSLPTSCHTPQASGSLGTNIPTSLQTSYHDLVRMQRAAESQRTVIDPFSFLATQAPNAIQAPGVDASRRTQGCNVSAGARPQAEDGSDSDSGQLSAERRRLSTLAIRRSVHTDIRRRAAARESLRQTLGSGTHVGRSLLMFGAESTPHGISATPRTAKVQERGSGFSYCATAGGLLHESTASASVVAKDDRIPRDLLILELPLCPQGHRPTLIAQINAQASPQFEQLGPYLFRIGCCKICRLQVRSLQYFHAVHFGLIETEVD